MNYLSRNILGGFIILALLVTSCQKENFDSVDVSALDSGTIVQLDSSVVDQIQEDDVDKIAYDPNVNLVDVRNGRSMIFSSRFTLNVFSTVDYYFSKADIEEDMTYTCVVTPIKGNPNLSVRSYLVNREPRYRMIRNNYSNGVETVSFTKKDLLPNENELNFVVQGDIGTAFKWEIYKQKTEDIAPNVSSTIAFPCECGREETVTLICENFESMQEGAVTDQSKSFMVMEDNPHIDAAVVKGENTGFESVSALQLKDITEIPTGTLNTESNIDLGNETSGSYLFTFNIKIPRNGKAEFESPAMGGKYTMNGNGRGSISIGDQYNVPFAFPINNWVEVQLGFIPDRGIYRLYIQDRVYTWVNSGDDNMLDYIKFLGTGSGYLIDDLCFERF